MDEIRIAIVGLGHRAVRSWIPLLQKLEGYRVTAICDPVKALHAAALAQLEKPRGVKCYTRYEEVLADRRVDAVGLTVRCREQGLMAAQALEAGKHVNQEVPASHSLEDCWRIVTAQERSGKVYLSAEQVRYAGVIEGWRTMVKAGALGKVTYAEGQYFHYYVGQCFRDPKTGKFFHPDEVAAHPEAERTWLWHMPPIHYLVHDLSPLLKILDDRVVEVVGMSTDSPSAAHPQLQWPDMQVALMKTEKGAVLRLAASFAQPHPERTTHWLQVIGTRGSVEWNRAANGRPKLWLPFLQMHDKGEADWRYERNDAPPEAHSAGHAGMDYYVHAHFRDAVLKGTALEYDVYKAMDVAACGILAADSIAQDNRKLKVPDFRPGALRARGEMPGS